MKFEYLKYVDLLAKELIDFFTNASLMSTPLAVGAAKEKVVLKKLESVLPSSIGVGSGFVIDSYGNVSKQMDIIIYEKSFCHRYIINETEEYSYYPCEGVIIAGEIKSELNNSTLRDSFEKAESIKRLRRYSVPEKSELNSEIIKCFRRFGNTMSMVGTREEEYDQDAKFTDQIMFFVLAEKLSTSREIILQNYSDMVRVSEYYPNITCCLSGENFYFYNQVLNLIKNTKNEANTLIVTSKIINGFQFLLRSMKQHITNARTVPLISYNRYFNDGKGISLSDALKIDL